MFKDKWQRPRVHTITGPSKSVSPQVRAGLLAFSRLLLQKGCRSGGGIKPAFASCRRPGDNACIGPWWRRALPASRRCFPVAALSSPRFNWAPPPCSAGGGGGGGTPPEQRTLQFGVVRRSSPSYCSLDISEYCLWITLCISADAILSLHALQYGEMSVDKGKDLTGNNEPSENDSLINLDKLYAYLSMRNN